MRPIRHRNPQKPFAVRLPFDGFAAIQIIGNRHIRGQAAVLLFHQDGRGIFFRGISAGRHNAPLNAPRRQRRPGGLLDQIGFNCLQLAANFANQRKPGEHIMAAAPVHDKVIRYQHQAGLRIRPFKSCAALFEHNLLNLFPGRRRRIVGKPDAAYL